MSDEHAARLRVLERMESSRVPTTMGEAYARALNADLAALDDLIAYAEARGRVAALEEHSYGQDGKAIWFTVRVYGLPAMPSSPAEIVRLLAAAWSRPVPHVSLSDILVTVADSALADERKKLVEMTE